MLGEAIANEAFTKGMLLKKKTMELLSALRPVLGMDPMTFMPHLTAAPGTFKPC